MSESPPSRAISLPLAALIACAVVMFGCRILGPSALYRFDQPKTATYTADMVVNGHWLLPRDILGNGTTKPLLVNWLAAPVVALGFWTEWAIKLPMLAGALATLVLCVREGHRLLAKTPELAAQPHTAAAAAMLAGIAWLTNPANETAIYHCRPDPLLVCLLTIGWILGTRIIDPARHCPTTVIVGFWLSVGFASLTKGPPALIAVLYLPLAARLLHGQWSLVHRSRWWWGLPLAAAMFACWIVPVALFYPEHFKTVLIGREVLAPALGLGHEFGNHQVCCGGPLAIITSLWRYPVWFFQRFAPWSLAAIAAAIVIGPRRWFRHPLGPALLWLLLVAGFYSLLANKTADYLLPAYPAAAILAAWFCAVGLQRWRLSIEHLALAGVAIAVGLSVDQCFFSYAARQRIGENLRDFAAGVRTLTHGEPIAFSNTGYNTLQFFLHAHQPDPPDPELLARARWVVMPFREGTSPLLISKKIAARSEREARHPPLALYPIEQARPLLHGVRQSSGALGLAAAN